MEGMRNGLPIALVMMLIAVGASAQSGRIAYASATRIDIEGGGAFQIVTRDVLIEPSSSERPELVPLPQSRWSCAANRMGDGTSGTLFVRCSFAGTDATAMVSSRGCDGGRVVLFDRPGASGWLVRAGCE